MANNPVQNRRRAPLRPVPLVTITIPLSDDGIVMDIRDWFRAHGMEDRPKISASEYVWALEGDQVRDLLFCSSMRLDHTTHDVTCPHCTTGKQIRKIIEKITP